MYYITCNNEVCCDYHENARCSGKWWSDHSYMNENSWVAHSGMVLVSPVSLYTMRSRNGDNIWRKFAFVGKNGGFCTVYCQI